MHYVYVVVFIITDHIALAISLAIAILPVLHYDTPTLMLQQHQQKNMNRTSCT